MNVQWSPNMFANMYKLEPNAQNKENEITPAETQTNFADMLKGAIENVNNLQNESDLMTEGLATGEVQDLHQVMITAQKASVTLEAAVQVQQKVLDAYNEIMRMQV